MGGHMTVECVSCHINGRLQGTPRQCIACHNGTLAPGMPANHLPISTTSCDTCHRNTAETFGPGTRMNHNGIIKGCTSCHDGQSFTGVTPVSKPQTHLATQSDCVDCHRSYVSFAGASASAMPSNHIPSSQACTLCHAAGYGPSLTVMSHSGISSGCTTCHNGTAFYGVTPVAKGANHIASTQDCSVCHSSTTIPGGFVTGAMSHTGITSGCATCHSGTAFQNVTPMAETAVNHVPTSSAPCETCHAVTTVPGGFASFTMGTAGHSALGVTTGSSCISCHLSPTYFGVKSKTDYASHPATTPSNENCSDCHKNFTSFSGASGGAMPANHIPTSQACTLCHSAGYGPSLTVMSHSGISSGCTTCHAGTAFYGVTPVSKGTNHFTTTQDCSLCHTSTTIPGGFITGTMSHTGISSGCATCHSGTAFQNVTPVSKGANHIASTQDCSVCHSSTTIPGGFVTGAMSHTGITSGCATCHSGTAFQNVTPMAETAVNHVPTSSAPCETCHAVTTVPGGFASFTMGTAGHSALGVTTGSSCISCHLSPTYFGVKSKTDYASHPATTPSNENCSDCHKNFTSFSGASGGAMPANHIPTSQACTLCHSAGYGPSLTVMSHSGISSGCTTCHAGTAFYGVTPVSKGSNHFTTTQDCSLCHTSTVVPGGFVTGAMNHTGISSGCTTCHSGTAFQNVTPVAKGSNHVPTTSDCVTCHTSFTSFVGATFNHTGITSGCATCHNGTAFQNVTPVTRAANHIPTSLDCSNCHKSTTVFGPGTAMNHTGIASGCATCHTGAAFQGVTPVSKPASHVSTTADCSSCHSSFTSFLGATYNHSGITSGCATCHTGTGGVVGKGSNHIPTSLDCSTCHLSTTAFGPSTAMNHTGISSGCVTCHSGAAFQGVTPKAKPASGHIPTTADCSTCHTSFTSFLGATYSHSGVTSGTCISCHNGTYAGVVSQTSVVSNHVPTAAVSCDVCHTGSKVAGGFLTYTVGNAGHAALGVTLSVSNCMTCHSGTYFGTKTFKPHGKGNFCGTCHKSFTQDPGH